jgi:hypothetical protein
MIVYIIPTIASKGSTQTHTGIGHFNH